MNDRNLEHPRLVINPLFARALGSDEVMVLTFPYRVGMRPAADRLDKTASAKQRPIPQRN